VPICVALYHEQLTSKALWYMAHVNEGSQFYLLPTRLSIRGMNHSLPAFTPSRRASPHFGRYSFSVPL